MDSLASLFAFVHAAEQQSYVGAARVAGVSPSAIGKAVARLENRLHVRLFNRTTRSISLTEEGAVLYERSKRIIDDIQDAEATVLQSRERPRGRLRVSVPHIVGHHLLMPMLPAFAERFPEIELDVDFEDRVIDMVTEGLDVVVRSGELADARLIARHLGEQHFVVCGSSEYLERHGRPETPGDLFKHACIHFKYPSSGRLAPWAFSAPYERLLLPKSLTFNNTDAGLRAAQDGLGLAHLPVYVAEAAMRAGTLSPVLTSFMVPFGSLSLVWPSNRQLSRKVRAFVDFVVETCAARPGAFRPAGSLSR
ncbi:MULTISPECIES: LysR family transcriptional regulator [Rhizobium]|uniref:LysR family transcriptional regulator n=1 Tax=Rhizobium TaxID=379 RepID=UPI001B31D6F9|nr:MULTISPECIES: LysR family transcriptional regulator [Rhizobium]MBX4908980.1 LysR family transcriptional regulator [Rhizobium bangladeshense]MBX5216112.1 LysR family transcriptional regulator [Rhizobium sp. NLR9a]MBX5223024.1 LysR family transcriptional regulator [Rhizobium sp. NLR8a]MBX5234492.1 LysR family transcriptional regulator [Rhizobium sp. NLR4a]MBX5246812.1 LysR family transcriptional regulator [Rhizobium sp. NLR3b]